MTQQQQPPTEEPKPDANSQGYEIWKVQNTCDTCHKLITECEGH